MRVLLLAFPLIFGLLACEDILYQDMPPATLNHEDKVETPEEYLRTADRVNGSKKPEDLFDSGELKEQKWPRHHVMVDFDLAKYGIDQKKIHIDLLAESNPKPYRYLSVILTNLEEESVDFAFSEQKPIINLFGKQIIPLYTGKCDYSELGTFRTSLPVTYKESMQVDKVFELNDFTVGEEIEPINAGAFDWYNIKPGKKVLINRYYSHTLSKNRPGILTRGDLPDFRLCNSSLYNSFFQRCNGKLGFSFMDECINKDQVHAVDFAVIDADWFDYAVRDPKTNKHIPLDFKLRGPTMTLP